MEWISVKDRIPDVGEWILIYAPVKESGLIEIAMLDILVGFINPALGYGSFKNVTHWMPLPAGPELAPAAEDAPK